MLTNLLAALTTSAMLIMTSSSETSPFRYARDRVPVGKLFHYVKSNIDGTHPDDVLIYVSSETAFDVLKLEPGMKTAVGIRATLDWKRFMAEKLDMRHLLASGNEVHVFQAEFLANGMRFSPRDLSTLPAAVGALIREPFTVDLPLVPAHVYGFELITLNLAFPHLKDPESTVKIGLLGDNPKFGPDDPRPIAGLGTATVTFERAEVRNGTTCRRYRIEGDGLGTLPGVIWTDAARGCIRDLEIPFANNGGWTSFKLKLASVREVSGAEWDREKKAALAHFFQGKRYTRGGAQ